MDADGPQEGRTGGFGSLSPVRALAVLVAFVAAVSILVAVGTRPTTIPSSEGSVTTTTVPTNSTTTIPATTTTTVPHSSVTVVVANATSVNGVAAHYSTLLSQQGWATKTPGDASTTATTSTVYYAAGQQAAATEIAATLGLPATAVQPISSATPISGTAGIDVVVVIGQDLASKPGA